MSEIIFWVLAIWFCWACWKDHMDFEQARVELSAELQRLLDKRW